jgi:hypothetical protein
VPDRQGTFALPAFLSSVPIKTYRFAATNPDRKEYSYGIIEEEKTAPP